MWNSKWLNTLNASSPVLSATVRAGDIGVKPLTPVAMLVTRSTLPLSELPFPP
jgi:hypothetical protein